MSRRKKTQSGAAHPPWLIIFSDLMTLLLTFFVLLVSIAVIDERSKLVALGSLTRSFGMGERLFNPLTQKQEDSAMEPGVMESPLEDLAPMRDMIYEDVEKDLNFQENKYVQIFSINDRVLFLPGETVLSPGGIELLDRVLPYLQRMQYPLLVAGHTAARRDEEHAGTYTVEPDHAGVDSTWPLSFRRARAVYRHLVDRGIPPASLSLEAFGQFHPRYTNNTPEGRQQNRRVELVLDKRNLEWIHRMKELGDKKPAVKKETSFRGFTFHLLVPGSSPREEGDVR